MSIGLIGRKVGMTQVFAEDGTMVAVSVVAIEPNTVTRLRTQATDGYTAVQLGAGTREKQTKPVAGQLRGLPPVRDRREFRLDDVSGYEVGQELKVEEIFSAGDLVDVIGVTKGKGFAGTIKRHHCQARPRDARLRLASAAGIHRRWHHARPRLPRAADGRPPGQRPPDDLEADRRAHRCRPQPAARQGRRARRA